jgi:hypothetical protein
MKSDPKFRVPANSGSGNFKYGFGLSNLPSSFIDVETQAVRVAASLGPWEERTPSRPHPAHQWRRAIGAGVKSGWTRLGQRSCDTWATRVGMRWPWHGECELGAVSVGGWVVMRTLPRDSDSPRLSGGWDPIGARCGMWIMVLVAYICRVWFHFGLGWKQKWPSGLDETQIFRAIRVPVHNTQNAQFNFRFSNLLPDLILNFSSFGCFVFRFG